MMSTTPGFLGCIIGGGEWVYGIKFDFGSAGSTVVRDRPGLSYAKMNDRFGISAKIRSRYNFEILQNFKNVFYKRYAN